MKYNILTVASKSYLPFLDIFLNSINENCDLNKINKIYIVDVDLNNYKNKLLRSDKIIYLNSDVDDKFGGVHSEGWYNVTKEKTLFLRQILNDMPEDESLIMIDSDTAVLCDLSELIDKKYDLQITRMSAGAHISASGVLILHIACLVIFNNIKKSQLFVERWIHNIKKLKDDRKPKPHETPAMNKTLEEDIMNDIMWMSMNDNEYCADLAYYKNTKIVHFKSDGSDKTTPLKNFINRFNNVKYHVNQEEKPELLKYLNRNLFNLWTQEDMNITTENFYNIKSHYKR